MKVHVDLVTSVVVYGRGWGEGGGGGGEGGYMCKYMFIDVLIILFDIVYGIYYHLIKITKTLTKLWQLFRTDTFEFQLLLSQN